MSRLYLVRHGQADFSPGGEQGLTPVGIRQCQALAVHWQAIGRRVDLVFAGSLRRQRESAEVFVRATAAAGGAAPELRTLAGVEEYDFRALMAARFGQAPAAVPADARAVHRRLVAALQAWTAGELSGVETFPAFRERCGNGLAAALAATGRGRQAAVFASAGSLAASMQRALGIGDADLIRLKLRFYNTGISTLLFDGETVTIESLNAIGHLERPEHVALVTHR